MKTILLVDEDKKLHSLVIDGLKAYGSVTTRETKDLIVKSASSEKEAVSILSRFKVDLVVTDVEGPDMDGFELLAFLKQGGYRDIPVIVVTAANSPKAKTRAKQMGVSHYLKKPFVLLELLEKMLDVLDEGSKALISDFTVPNFLQALEMEEKTCTLAITSKGKVGHLHLNGGELVDAETNELTGNDAAIEILGWDDTELQVEELSSNKKTIRASLMQILMQAAQEKDEKASAPGSSDSVLDEVVTLAENLHYKQAQEKLTTFLKTNMRSHQAWLWFSRITNKMTLIDKSLNNAKKIAPNDPMVLKEIDKVDRAKQVLEEGPIWRCPFCWAPLNVEVFECPSCHAYLLVDEALMAREQSGNGQVLQHAIDRYTRAVSGKANPDAHYYLGIAHLNLGQWEKGLDELNNTVHENPEKQFYSDQLQMLINLITSTGNLYTQETTPLELGAALSPGRLDETAPKRILVVENSPTIRKAICVAMSQHGYEVMEAGDGLELINCLDMTRPDVIVMDMFLPKLDAEKIFLIMRDNSRLENIPVILLTNEKGLDRKAKKKLAGAKAFVPKPLDLTTLLEATEKCLL
jgi:twitching motility two-component system response regulator PilG